MTTKQATAIHFTSTFGERDDGKYHRCNKCDSKTMLISAPTHWDVDQEPFANGEIEAVEDGYVEVTDEVSAHYCPECRHITSLSFNARR